MPLGLKGLATGIGSFPHKNAEEALEVIFRFCPEIPFWPQLPKRDIKEGMVAQFSEGLPHLGVDRDAELEKFYDRVINQDSDYFKISPGYAAGLHKFYERLEKSDLSRVKFIKCQIVGPFTFAASIKDEKGVALLHDPVAMQAIIKGLAMKALWQVKLFEKFKKKMIIFIDEPYLGCFGSAYTPINREDVVKSLSELIQEIKRPDILWGLHCCGNTDWSILTDVRSMKIISFDAFGFLDKLVLYADDLKKFFEEERALCWGIAPTQEFSGQDTPEGLVEKVKAGIEALVKKGLSAEKVLQDIFFSPSCGLGALDTPKAEQIFRLLSDLSRYYKK